MSKLDLLNQTFQFRDILTDNSGWDACFSKPIAVLKLWAQADPFEYDESYKQKGSATFNKFVLGLKHSKLKKNLFPP